MDREELIEQATWALIDHDTDVVDRGVADDHYQERRADAERVFAVFEQAHTPTPELSSKSDWEALTLIVRDVHNYDGRPEWLSLSGADAGRIAAAAIAAGFRRTVQGEPTDAQVRAAHRAWDAAPRDMNTSALEYMRAALRAAAAVREEGQGHG